MSELTVEELKKFESIFEKHKIPSEDGTYTVIFESEKDLERFAKTWLESDEIASMVVDSEDEHHRRVEQERNLVLKEFQKLDKEREEMKHD